MKIILKKVAFLPVAERIAPPLRSSNFRCNYKLSHSFLHSLTMVRIFPAIITLAMNFSQPAIAETDRLPLPKGDTPFPSIYNVIWEKPGKLPSGSMPTGNGDLSINAWVEEGGDLLFYIGKTDSWSELERLLKVGRVRVHLNPNPFVVGQPFRQELKLEDGTIAIRAGAPGKEVSIRLYADANHPVIRFECTSDEAIEVNAAMEMWRTTDRDLPMAERMSAWGDRDSTAPLIESADVLVPNRQKDVICYHRNASSIWEGTLRLQGLENLIGKQKDPLMNRTSGAVMRGPNFMPDGSGSMKAPPAKRQEFGLHVLTSITDTPEKWQQQVIALADATDAIPAEKAWTEHQAWWSGFWSRSHVVMSGPLINAAAPIITPVPVPLRIGSGDGGMPFQGKIARARLYRAALDSAAIEALAADRTGKAERLKSVIADWDLAQPDANGNYANQQGEPLPALRSGEIAIDQKDSLPVFSSSGHLLVPHDLRLDPIHALTLESWVYAESQPEAGGRILDKGLGGTQQGYVLDTYPGNSLRLISKDVVLTAENVLPIGEWAHVAATLDGKNGVARIYLNGKVVAESKVAFSSSIRNAADIAQVYNLQRFLMAASSRGSFPPKFNGATFNVDYLATGGSDADFRAWGGSYWLQNTRHLHWPNLADGDFDLMKPFFKLYTDTLELGRERNRVWYGHEGAFFPETMNFWGTHATSDYGRNRDGLKHGDVTNPHIKYHLTDNLEFVAALLRYYIYTEDEQFARETLIPAAKNLLLFWDKRYSRDEKGLLVMAPAQAMEAYWNVVNPACDVAGLTYVLDGLLSLSPKLLSTDQRDVWTKLRAAVPPLPIRVSEGKEYLAVAEQVNSPSVGMESPELYSIHPFPLFGVGKPGLERAIRSYWERPNERPGSYGWNTCWSYLSTISARLGLTEEAAQLIASRAALFWGPRFFPDNLTNGDWIPDMDNTGSMAFSVQSMLLQSDGDKILVAPAWPKQWEADFKLHAPQNTVVSGSIRAGKLENLKVVPETRAGDVIDCLANPPVAH